MKSTLELSQYYLVGVKTWYKEQSTYVIQFCKIENKMQRVSVRGRYVVFEGRNPGIYETWDECKEQVLGFSNAVYKKFPTAQEAYARWTNHCAQHDARMEVAVAAPAPVPQALPVGPHLAMGGQEGAMMRMTMEA